MLIFRLDPGIQRDHTGTNGRIVQTIYDPEADRWDQDQTVYNSTRYSLPDDQQGLQICTADPDDVVGKPQN